MLWLCSVPRGQVPACFSSVRVRTRIRIIILGWLTTCTNKGLYSKHVINTYMFKCYWRYFTCLNKKARLSYKQINFQNLEIIVDKSAKIALINMGVRRPFFQQRIKKIPGGGGERGLHTICLKNTRKIRISTKKSRIPLALNITVPSTSCKTSLDMAVVDINKNFLYNPVRPAFWEVDSTWSFPLLL